MRQIPLPIGFDAKRSFDNFVTGRNALALEHLQRHARNSPPVYLWGPSAAGKSHLLAALAERAQADGQRVARFDADTPLPWPFEEGVELILFDDCARFDAERQQAAFGLFVEATTHAVAIVAAGRVPPVDLPLRDVLRTRFGWGHVLALQPWTEAESRAALRRDADRRGLFLSDDVMDFLLVRFARDLKHLIALLDRLDEYAMATQRQITIPMVRKMLAEEG